jgi:uncharacterized protein
MLEMATHHHFFAIYQASKSARLGTFASGSLVRLKVSITTFQGQYMSISKVIIGLILSMLLGSGVAIADDKKQSDVKKFINHILNEEYDHAYEYIGDKFSWRAGGADKVLITSKKEFISIAPKIFNNVFIEAVKNTEKIEVTCCLSSLEILNLGTRDIIFWFKYGKPYLLANNTIIRPSFNCSKAQTDVEKTICQSLLLSKQDQQLASSYKEAQVFLTGDASNTLKAEQIKFIEDRNSCNESVSCIETKTKDRILKLKSLVESSYTSSIINNFDIENIPEQLNSKRSFSAAYCGKYSNEEYKVIDEFNIAISIEDREILISNGDKQKTQECYIDSSTSTTFSKLFYNTLYRENYYGSCGGSYTQLPYFGNYNFIKLKASDTNENCGYLVTSFNKSKKPVFIYSKEEPIADILIDTGHVLIAQ